MLGNRDGHPNKKEGLDGKFWKLNWISLYFNNENLSTYIYTVFFFVIFLKIFAYHKVRFVEHWIRIELRTKRHVKLACLSLGYLQFNNRCFSTFCKWRDFLKVNNESFSIKDFFFLNQEKHFHICYDKIKMKNSTWFYFINTKTTPYHKLHLVNMNIMN